MSYQLYNGSPEQVFSNLQLIANVTVPVFGWQVPAQTKIKAPSIIQLILSLVNSSGNQLSDNARISLTAQTPAGTSAKPISSEKTIAGWNALSLAQQNNSNNDTDLVMDQAYTFPPFTTIFFNIKDTVTESLGSSVQVVLKGLIKENA